jgi:MYXO-CTERM domain-containing protein
MVALLLPENAFAFSGGRDGGGCPGCHGDTGAGYASTVISAVPLTPLQAGVESEIEIKVVDQTGGLTKGGFFAGASQDFFAANQSRDLLFTSPVGVSHMGVKSPLSDGWRVRVKPLQEGDVDLILWGNAVDGNGTSGAGDRPSGDTAVTLTVGPAPAGVDAGVATDGGADSGAGSPDAGAADAGSVVDASIPVDSGSPTAEDAGSDAGTPPISSDGGGCATSPTDASSGSGLGAAGLLAVALFVQRRRR